MKYNGAIFQFFSVILKVISTFLRIFVAKNEETSSLLE